MHLFGEKHPEDQQYRRPSRRTDPCKDSDRRKERPDPMWDHTDYVEVGRRPLKVHVTRLVCPIGLAKSKPNIWFALSDSKRTISPDHDVGQLSLTAYLWQLLNKMSVLA